MATKTVVIVTPTKATTRILPSEMVGVVRYIIMFAQFLLCLKKITYFHFDCGRSWHLLGLILTPICSILILFASWLFLGIIFPFMPLNPTMGWLSPNYPRSRSCQWSSLVGSWVYTCTVYIVIDCTVVAWPAELQCTLSVPYVCQRLSF